MDLSLVLSLIINSTFYFKAGVRTFVRSVLVYLFETEEIYPKMDDLDRK